MRIICSENIFFCFGGTPPLSLSSQSPTHDERERDEDEDEEKREKEEGVESIY